MAPHRPTLMCSATSSTLLYESDNEVYCLDLSESQPKAAGRKCVTCIDSHNILFDMCFDQDGDKPLLIGAHDHDGVSAYNTETDKREWAWKGKLPGMEADICASGVATNGRGHLFVADSKNCCIQMFSVSKGYYMGCVMKDVETFGCPYCIRWCENTSSLICLCLFKPRAWFLKVLDVQYPSNN